MAVPAYLLFISLDVPVPFFLLSGLLLVKWRIEADSVFKPLYSSFPRRLVVPYCQQACVLAAVPATVHPGISNPWEFATKQFLQTLLCPSIVVILYLGTDHFIDIISATHLYRFDFLNL